MVIHYDNADRLIASVDPDTNGGTAGTRPDTVPSSSATLLVTQYAYNAAGEVQDTIDPMGIKDRTLYDNLGRTIETIQDYTDGTETSDSNITTEYGYDGDNHVIYVRADEPGGAYQQTNYLYGVTTATSSWINSNDILGAIEYPDPTTGQPSASQEDIYHVNALGQLTTQYLDRNGTGHQYGYDTLGRLIYDFAWTVGAGVDGTMREIGYTYDSQGNLSSVTGYGYNNDTGPYAINDIKDVYNGLGQLTGEYQSHNGNGITGSTPEVQYAYNEMANGANNSRLVSMTYPDGYTLNYNYNSGLDDHISRLSSISDASNTLEAYKYLGLATVVERDHPQINVNQYIGLDQFGRIDSDNWYNTNTATPTDDFAYGYDQDSNVLYKQNLVDAAMSELYQYNNLDELIYFARGTLSPDDTTIANPTASQSFSLDALGNITDVVTSPPTISRGATFNQQNEITSMDGAGTISYDGDGNLTADGSGNTYVYNAWNELVAVKNSSGTTIAAYGYDGLGRRITVTENTTTTDLYYSSADQVVEEDVGGVAQSRNVWSPVYVNALVLIDQSSQHNGVLDQRLYVQQDANWNVTALVDTSGNVVERYDYLPYGSVTVLNPDFSIRDGSNYAMLYLWQGESYDPTTGLYRIGVRDVSPILMKPLEADPLGQAPGVNRYEWEGDGPVDMVDPSGLDPATVGRPWYDYFPDYFIFPLALGLRRELGRSTDLDAQRQAMQVMENKKSTQDILNYVPRNGNGEPIAGGLPGAGSGLTPRQAGPEAAQEVKDMLKDTGMFAGSMMIPGPEVLAFKAFANLRGFNLVKKAGKWVLQRCEGGGKVPGVKTLYAKFKSTKFFKSFGALKRGLGPAGKGKVWHHIVEQRSANVARFGAEAIHNTENVVAISREANQALANYYASKQSFTRGMIVRKWLETQSFAEQTEFGQKILDLVLGGKPLP